MIEAVRVVITVAGNRTHPFGKHDLALALEACKLLGIESGK